MTGSGSVNQFMMLSRQCDLGIRFWFYSYLSCFSVHHVSIFIQVFVVSAN